MRGRRPVIGISADQDGEYLKLRHSYSCAVLHAGGAPVLLPPCDEPRFYRALIDGLLIPGGGDMDPSYYSEEPRHEMTIVPKARTDFEMALLKAIMEAGKPVFGICYGMQLLNVALGGNLYQDIRSEWGTSVDHVSGSHRIVCRAEWLRGEFPVNTSHHQAVRNLGKGLEVMAVADDGLVEAIRLSGYPFLAGVQWHPERSADGLSVRLIRSFVEAASGFK